MNRRGASSTHMPVVCREGEGVLQHWVRTTASAAQLFQMRG